MVVAALALPACTGAIADDSGASVVDGGGDTAAAGCSDCALSDADSFSLQVDLAIATTALPAGQDAWLDWSALTTDILERPVARCEDLDAVTLSLFPQATPEEVTAGLAMDHLEAGSIGALWQCTPTSCACALSDFSFVGHPLVPKGDFTEGRGTWLLSLSGGDAAGLRGLALIDAQADATATTLQVEDHTSAASVSASFSAPLLVAPDAVLDWTGLTADGWGQALELHRLDRIRLDAVALSADALAGRLLDLNALAAPSFEADIEGSTSLSLETLTGGAGLVAAPDATWLLTLWCSTCSLDLPRVGVLLAPAG